MTREESNPRRELAILRGPGSFRPLERVLVLAPHPDDFDVVAVTLRRLFDDGAELRLELLTSGASGVEDEYALGWRRKTEVREAEQRASCRLFGLDAEHLRFHRLREDQEGHLIEDPGNEAATRDALDRWPADAVVLPHGNDSNADHRRVYRIFERWAREQRRPLRALLVRDPKSLGGRLDLVTPFDDSEAAWKARLLRCHDSQQQRNLRTRDHGLDERILDNNRQIADEVGVCEPYAEGFEIARFGEALSTPEAPSSR